jgi:hypothetical protein
LSAHSVSPIVLLVVAAGLAACDGANVALPTPPSPSLPVTPRPQETGTPLVPPSPTAEASATPFPFPSRLPPSIPVYGTISVRVFPLEGSDALAGPSAISMTWTVKGIEEEIHQLAQNARTGDFRMVLPPGETYELTELEINDPAFGFESAGLVAHGPEGTGPLFTVPASGCLYLGRITFTYTKLPPGDTLQHLQLAGDLAQGQSLAILFTGAGTFVYFPDDPTSHRFQLPPVDRRPREARSCEASRPTFGT